MTELTHDDVKKILEIIDGMRDCEVRLEIGELKLHVSTQPGGHLPVQRTFAPVKTAATAAALAPRPAPVVEVPPGQVAVRAPTMGTFYRAAAPGAKSYVEVGDRVQPDDTVAVFEVMKLFSSLKAEIAGTVSAILVANATLVEQDQPLILIAPAI